MMNIGYFKGQPTEYVLKYAGGKLAREGQGLAFYYLRHNTQVVAVPTSSTDANFVFNETTSNFQAVTIQGQATYRNTQSSPALLRSLLGATCRNSSAVRAFAVTVGQRNGGWKTHKVRVPSPRTQENRPRLGRTHLARQAPGSTASRASSVSGPAPHTHQRRGNGALWTPSPNRSRPRRK